MRTLVPLFAALLLSFGVMVAQPPGGGGGKKGGPPKNLKILPADQNLIPTMRSFTVALGVQCDFCHEADRSLDSKETKVMARMMLGMVKEINGKFPDGKDHVSCYTCHRGAQMPLTAPPQ